MSIGPSGRVVIEVDPEVKSRLHSVLRAQETTLKDWFIRHALDELERSEQLALELDVHSTFPAATKGESHGQV